MVFKIVICQYPLLNLQPDKYKNIGSGYCTCWPMSSVFVDYFSSTSLGKYKQSTETCLYLKDLCLAKKKILIYHGGISHKWNYQNANNIQKEFE